MPNPKRRHSNSRTRMRRAHDALTSKVTSDCPQCHQPKLPHRICTNCGYYAGRPVMKIEG